MRARAGGSGVTGPAWAWAQPLRAPAGLPRTVQRAPRKLAAPSPPHPWGWREGRRGGSYFGAKTPSAPRPTPRPTLHVWREGGNLERGVTPAPLEAPGGARHGCGVTAAGDLGRPAGRAAVRADPAASSGVGVGVNPLLPFPFPPSGSCAGKRASLQPPQNPGDGRSGRRVCGFELRGCVALDGPAPWPSPSPLPLCSLLHSQTRPSPPAPRGAPLQSVGRGCS